jgi:hypothetical protein
MPRRHGESDPEVLSVIYEGGLASQGELHFYEYGRAAYAIARLIATIEHFRRTGSVANRITQSSYVSLLIKAPERGSFPIDVIIPVIAEGTRIVAEYHIPVGVFLEYVIHTVKSLLPKQEKMILELAKLDLQKEQQRTLHVASIPNKAMQNYAYLHMIGTRESVAATLTT